jgi:hypothetical protein
MFAGKSVVKGFVLAALATIGIGAAAPSAADADVIRPNFTIGTPIALGCANPSSHQDVAKTPVLKNVTTAAIPKGRTLYWKSTDGDSGSVKLEADLAPGATIQGIGKPGNGYSCTGNFVTSADLTVKKAQWASATSATIEVQNLDLWVDAPATVTRVEVVSCSGSVLATADLPAMALAKGQSKSATVVLAPTSGKKYLRVRADANKTLLERSEVNNLWDDINSCVE